MAKNLDEVKQELYDAFNEARERASQTNSLSAYSYPEQAKIGIEAVKAAAETARAITMVERELAERDEKKNGIKMPGKN